MNVFGTLGFTPAKFLPTLRQRADVRAALVFHDDDARSLAAAAEVARYCNDLGLPFESVQVDAFDIVGCAAAMQERIRHAGPAEVLFNVTGGTKVVSAAAVLACILEGARAVYIHEETGDEVPLPLITARYERLLSEPQRRVLRHIARHPGCSQADIVQALDVSKPTVSHHIKELARFGLLRQEGHTDDARRKSLFVIPSAKLLLGEAP